MPKKSSAHLRAVGRIDKQVDRRLASGWLRMSQLPIGNTLARTLISQGLLDSVLVASPGSKRGVRLVSQESLDRYFKSLLPKAKAGAPAQ